MIMMLKASTPDYPILVSIVWRREWSTKSAGKMRLRFFLPSPRAHRRSGAVSLGGMLLEGLNGVYETVPIPYSLRVP
ncbi:MAG: hypothetical protein WBE38_00490, partial [Terracidiphilus sp.]